MGTLGCVNDMLRRDKENRELRKIGRERMKETRSRLLDWTGNSEMPTISLTEWETIASKTKEKEKADERYLLKIKLLFFIVTIGILLLGIVFIFIGIETTV